MAFKYLMWFIIQTTPCPVRIEATFALLQRC